MTDGSPGEMLQQWRASHDYTQTQAASLAKIGQSLWNAWENETRIPSIERAVRLEDLTDGAVPVRAWANVVLGARAAEKAAARARTAKQRARAIAGKRRRSRRAQPEAR